MYPTNYVNNYEKGHIVSNKIITFGTKFATLMEKNLKVLTILSLFLMFGIFSANAQTYEQMWKSVEKYDNDDLPKQVISEAEKIFDKAEREHNYVQMLKSWKTIVEKKSDIDPEVFAQIVEGQTSENSYDSSRSKAGIPILPLKGISRADSAVYHAVMWSAYRVMQHSAINDYDEDTKERYARLGAEHLEAAMADMHMLADTRADKYLPLMSAGEDSRLYDNDLLHVLFTFASYWSPSETAEMGGRCANIYKERGNLNGYALMKLSQLGSRWMRHDEDHHMSRQQYADSLKALLEEVKNTEAGADVAQEYLSFSELGDDERLAFARWAIGQYPDHKLTNSFRNVETQIMTPTMTSSFDGDGILAGRPFRVEFETCNMTQIDLTVRKYDGKDRNNNLKTTGQTVAHFTLPVAQDMVNSQRRAQRLITRDTVSQEITLPAGHYVVSAEGDGVSDNAELLVTSMMLIAFELDKKQTMTAVVDNSTGHPVTDATLTLADRTGKNPVTMPTDASGEAVIDITSYRFVKAQRSDDDITSQVMASSRFWGETEAQATVTTLLTDRSIYRPGQKVHVYGIVYDREGDETRVRPNHSEEISLYDANYQLVTKKEVRTGDAGSFDTEFDIPADRMPGDYRIAAGGADRYFKVEEYKRPSFRIDMYADSTAAAARGDDRGYAFGDTLPVVVEAKTYSGTAVQGATVKYRIERANSTFWFTSGNWKECESGELTTDDDGRVTIPMLLDDQMRHDWAAEHADDQYSDDTRREYMSTMAYRVMVDITDLAGETQSEEFNTRISDLAFMLHIKTGSTDIDLSTKPEMTIEAYDVTHHKVAAEGTIEICYNTNTRPYYLSGQSYIGEAVYTGHFTANQPMKVPALAPGSYVVRATAYDKRQNKIAATQRITLYDTSKAVKPGTKVQKGDTHFSTPRIICPDPTFAPGKDAHVYVAPAHDDAYMFYYLFSNDKVIRSERINLGKDMYDIPIKYNKEYGDGVKVQMSYVKDGTLYNLNTDIRLQEPDKQLELAWHTFRNRLQPGQQEEWILTVKDKNGKAVSGAELLATMYDSSLDAINPHDIFFRIYFDRRIRTRSINHSYYQGISLNGYGKLHLLTTHRRQFNTLTEYFHERFRRMAMMSKSMTIGAAAPANYGILMSEEIEEDMLMTEEAAVAGPASGSTELHEIVLVPNEATEQPKPVIRSNFAETAFFMPHLTTDSEGNAHIAFTLPESLTEWKFMGLAHTADMDYANITETITAQKQFMVQPNMPRFVREGDYVSIVTRIINQSDKAQDGQAVIRIINPETDELVFSDTKPFTLETGKTASVGFEFDAPDQYPMLVCEITGVGSDYSDGERNYLPVLTSKRHLTETQPFYILPAEGADAKDNTVTVDLTSLFNHNSSTATQKRLSFEYTARPEWTVIEALEGISLPKDDNAISYAASLYANTVATRIANSVPGLKEAVAKGIERDNAKTSEISDDQELKDILLKESPWVLEAMGEADQRAAIIDLFNDYLMAGRTEKAKNKLISMQKGNGSWGWFDDMSGSYYVTLTVAANLARLGADNPMKTQLNRALNYLDAEELETYNYRKKHRLSMNPSNSTLQYMELYTMMPDRKPGKDVSKMIETYLSEVEKNVKDLTIYGRANASNILRYFGHTKSADKFMQSVIEYSTTKPGMGRYFATDNAYYSWLDYKIPTQIAAMKAIRDKHPELLPDMQLWLLRQKQTQTWDNPINTVEAIDFLNSNTAAISHPALAVSPKVTFAGCQTEEYPVDTTKFLAEQLGYVKQVISPEVYADGLTTMEVKAQPQGLISWGAVYAQCLDGLDRVQASSSGELKVSRRIIEVDGNGNTRDKQEFHVGDKVTMRVSISADRDMDFVQVRCQHPACFEPTDQHSGFMWMGSRGGYMARHDASTDIFFDRFTKGTTTFDITFTVTRTGIYQSGIATAQCAYAPEFSAHSAGSKVEVK